MTGLPDRGPDTDPSLNKAARSLRGRYENNSLPAPHAQGMFLPFSQLFRWFFVRGI